jgi:hypothetical protein
VVCCRFSDRRLLVRDAVAKTDADGRFTIARAPNETVSFCGFLKGTAVEWASSGPNSQSATIRLHPLEPATVRLVDRSGKPIEGIRIGPGNMWPKDADRDTSEDPFQQCSSVSDRDGRATVQRMPLTANFDLADDRYAIASVKDGPVTTLVLEPACEIEGVVTASGRLVKADVVGVSQPRGLHRDGALTDSEGRFHLRGFPSGMAVLGAHLGLDDLANWAVRPVRIRLKPGVNHCDLMLERGSLVYGHVHRSDGKPFADARVMLTNFGWPFVLYALRWTDSDGGYAMRVIPGSYDVVVED